MQGLLRILRFVSRAPYRMFSGSFIIIRDLQSGFGVGKMALAEKGLQRISRVTDVPVEKRREVFECIQRECKCKPKFLDKLKSVLKLDDTETRSNEGVGDYAALVWLQMEDAVRQSMAPMTSPVKLDKAFEIIHKKMLKLNEACDLLTQIIYEQLCEGA